MRIQGHLLVDFRSATSGEVEQDRKWFDLFVNPEGSIVDLSEDVWPEHFRSLTDWIRWGVIGETG